MGSSPGGQGSSSRLSRSSRVGLIGHSSQHTPHRRGGAEGSRGVQPRNTHHEAGQGAMAQLHRADHKARQQRGTCGGLGSRPQGSGVRLHVLLQLPEPLDKFLRLLVGATLQHPKRGPHCGRGRGRCQSCWPRPHCSVTLGSAGGGASIGPAGPAPPEAHSPWARGRRRCRVTGWLALALPPTWGLATPPTLPRPRAASPAKSLVDSQSWSMTVNSTQAPRRRQASAGTELRGERGGGSLSGALLPTPGRQGGEGHSQVEELVVYGVQRPALDLGPLAADQREKVRRAQLHDHKGVA